MSPNPPGTRSHDDGARPDTFPRRARRDHPREWRPESLWLWPAPAEIVTWVGGDLAARYLRSFTLHRACSPPTSTNYVDPESTSGSWCRRWGGAARRPLLHRDWRSSMTSVPGCRRSAGASSTPSGPGCARRGRSCACPREGASLRTHWDSADPRATGSQLTDPGGAVHRVRACAQGGASCS